MSTRIPVVRIADRTVAFATIAPGGFRILAALDGLTKVLGFDVVITSGTDSHPAGRHPVGEAYDVSVKGWAVPVIGKAQRYLRQTLGERFTVLYEVPSAPTEPTEAALAFVNGRATGKHLHVQVRKGTTYPPEEPIRS